MTRKWGTFSIVLLVVVLPLALGSCGGKKAVKSDYKVMPATPRQDDATRPSSPVSPSGSSDRLTLEDIPFDYDQHTLRPDAQATLSRHAKALQERPDLSLLIEGHCDERGSVEYNLALGERRARAVMDYFVAYGISPARISVVTFGEERPLEFGHDEAAWARNRRASFVIPTGT